jgi:hypothetical protein
VRKKRGGKGCHDFDFHIVWDWGKEGRKEDDERRRVGT